MPQESPAYMAGSQPEAGAIGKHASGQEIELGVSKLEGPPVPGGNFVQVFESTPDGELLEKRGLLFAVLELSGLSESDPANAAQLVWDTLSEEYYALPSEETPIAALEQAVYAARGKLRQFSQNSTLELAVFAFCNNVVYSARVGKSALYLRRGVDVRNLLPGEEATSIGSTLLEGDDLLILGSPGFARNFTPQTLPETRLLVSEFEKGAKMPGLSAYLFEVRNSLQAEAEISPKLTISPFLIYGRKAAETARELAGKIFGKAFSIAAKKVEETFPNFSSSSLVDRVRTRISMPRLILILVAIFGISVAFTLWQQAKKVQAEEFERLVAQADSDLSEADGLVGLSNEKAKGLVTQAQSDLSKASKISPNSPKLGPLLGKAAAIFNAIEKITPVTAADLFFDLGGQARGVSLTGNGQTLYVTDGKSSSTFSVSSSNPPASQKLSVTGDELVSEDKYLYLREKGKLSRLNLTSSQVDEPISFDRFDKVASMDTYLGNIYFLVPSEDQIYKFLVTPNGYSTARSWLKEAVVLQNAIDLTIDGDVWVLTSDGKIIHLVGGTKVPFDITNLPTPFQNPNKIFTRPNLNNIYVLDKGANRVVILDKNGNFVRQFKGDVLSDLIGLWVSGDEKNLYLLSGSKIYRVGL